MNHYINLLDRSEIEYHSSGGIPPVAKPLAVAVLVLVLGNMILQYNSLKSTVAEGERLKETWERIEEDVEEAKALSTQKERLSRARKTLEGWPVSQHDWPDLIEFFAEQAPVPAEDIQFTRFSYEEVMKGMRNQIPRASSANYHPLKRQASVKLQGMIRTDRPQRRLPEYRRSVAEGENAPSAIADVMLANPVILEDAEGNPTGISQFSLSIELKEREVLP